MRDLRFNTLFVRAIILGSAFLPFVAQATLQSKLSTQSLSAERMQRARDFVDFEVRADLAKNLDERIAEVTDKAAEKALIEKEPAMSRETQAVILKGAFLALQSQTPFRISEVDFNRGMAKILDFLAEHHTFPQAITIGVLQRVTVGEGITVGGNIGVEANFYLQKGKLMMTNYQLIGAQGGVGTATAITEFYAGLCFGSCYGGDPNGWYVGFDGNIAGGLGVGFFLEVGLDVSDYFDSFIHSKPYTMKDMYEAAAVYIGFGFEEGIGGGFSGNLYRYTQIGKDTVLSNPGQMLKPKMISSKGALLQH